MLSERDLTTGGSKERHHYIVLSGLWLLRSGIDFFVGLKPYAMQCRPFRTLCLSKRH